jgi:phosphatidate cytidylyltransferase
MSNILSSSSTRIKTGVVLLLGILVIGYIDSYFVMWVLFGSLLAIALHEAQKLFSFENKYIYVTSAILWIAAYFHPTPEDLVFVVALVYVIVYVSVVPAEPFPAVLTIDAIPFPVTP